MLFAGKKISFYIFLNILLIFFILIPYIKKGHGPEIIGKDLVKKEIETNLNHRL